MTSYLSFFGLCFKKLQNTKFPFSIWHKPNTLLSFKVSRFVYMHHQITFYSNYIQYTFTWIIVFFNLIIQGVQLPWHRLWEASRTPPALVPHHCLQTKPQACQVLAKQETFQPLFTAITCTWWNRYCHSHCTQTHPSIL